MAKPFKTVEEQVGILKQRGLQIKDDAVTARYLLFNNYYNVVNHYGKFFQINTDIYIDGATFDEIRCLFLFDKELKSLLFKACLDIEKNIKSLTAYYYSENFRAPYAYLNPDNYEIPNDEHTERCINKLKELINKNKSYTLQCAISHYATFHEDIPLWVLTNEMQFGTINSLYKNMKMDIRNKVAKCFAESFENEYNAKVLITPDVLWKSMYGIQELRNVCGHNNRLLNHNFRYSIPFVPILYPSGYDGSTNRNNVYHVYLQMKLFLKKEQFNSLTNAIKKRMRNYLKNKIHSIPYNYILKSLGFPKDWV